MYDTTNKQLKVWNGSASITVASYAPVLNYITATQALTDTTFVDVIGTSPATFTFSAVASGVYVAEYYLPVTFSGTGGLKVQFTTPSSPTANSLSFEAALTVNVSTTDNLGASIMRPVGSLSANSSTTIVTADAGTYYTSGTHVVKIHMLYQNGVNAGSVTLQAAQNSDNGTTTLSVGGTMRVERIA